jgi:hypothetical protein
MASDVVAMGGYVGLAAGVLRCCLVQQIVVLWSLMAGREGREHALKLLALLRRK